jgi:hypothetical protein
MLSSIMFVSVLLLGLVLEANGNDVQYGVRERPEEKRVELMRIRRAARELPQPQRRTLEGDFLVSLFNSEF